MGWPSSHEHNQEKRDDAAFVEHKMDPELRSILLSPVSKKSPRKKKKGSSGAPTGKLAYLESLECTVKEQTKRIQKLEIQLGRAEKALEAERLHLRQLKERANKDSDLLGQAARRQLDTELNAKVAQLEDALRAKDQELIDLRKMHELFSTR